ncbi:hypothetical protein [Magnetospirillum sp. SS-4]|uniref:hypothetical protein n=1 Tax=Magnetospirillum sp. SS-4 TaxID=2681465 RepID=UPI001572B44E|nr:hypothetical protein [Magnetospirillum sp. SS-4]
MNASLIEIIGSAIVAARQVGLDRGEEIDAARAVLLALDPSLTPGVARILVEQLCPSAEVDAAA